MEQVISPAKEVLVERAKSVKSKMFPLIFSHRSSVNVSEKKRKLSKEKRKRQRVPTELSAKNMLMKHKSIPKID